MQNLTTRGTVEAIWIKRGKGEPMDSVPSAKLIAGRGIAGNADQGGKRQVTIIEQEVWDQLMEQVGGSQPASARRANLMVSGIRLVDSQDRILRVGSCRIRIHGETKPCRRMEDTVEGLRGAMEDGGWKGGAYGEVIEGGEISVGDPAFWEE